MAKDKVEGKFDDTGTSSRVVSPGQFAPGPEGEGAAPRTYADIEHGSGPRGLKKIGKKFLHLKSALKKHYGTTKKAA